MNIFTLKIRKVSHDAITLGLHSSSSSTVVVVKVMFAHSYS